MVVLYVVTSRLLMHGLATSYVPFLTSCTTSRHTFDGSFPHSEMISTAVQLTGVPHLPPNRIQVAVFTKSALRHVQLEGGGVSPLG